MFDWKLMIEGIILMLLMANASKIYEQSVTTYNTEIPTGTKDRLRKFIFYVYLCVIGIFLVFNDNIGDEGQISNHKLIGIHVIGQFIGMLRFDVMDTTISRRFVAFNFHVYVHFVVRTVPICLVVM